MSELSTGFPRPFQCTVHCTSRTDKRHSQKSVPKVGHKLIGHFEIKSLKPIFRRISSHLSLNCEGRWGATDDFAASFLHFALFSTALWDLANSRPVHSLMLFSHFFLCLPCLLPPFTVLCKMVFARPDERET